METVFAKAPPMIEGFGDWTDLVPQISGPITYQISATAMGSLAKVFGEVRYWDEEGDRRVDSFVEHIEITTTLF